MLESLPFSYLLMTAGLIDPAGSMHAMGSFPCSFF